MSDIDFLGHQNHDHDQESERKKDVPEKIIWSDPKKDKIIQEKSLLSFLPFVNKNKNQPVASAPGPVADKDKIRQSRQEILKSIKNNQNFKTDKDNRLGQNLWSGLSGKFNGRKEALIDYQRVFNQEKVEKNRPAPAPAAAPIVKIAPEKKPAVEVLSIQPKNDWLGDFIKMISKFLAKLNTPKIKPAKIDLTASYKKEARPEASKPETPPAPAAVEVKAPEKIKEKEPEITETAQFEEPGPKILETNLIKGEIVSFFDWRKKIIIFIGAILIPIILTGAFYYGLQYYYKQILADNQEQTKKFNDLVDRTKQAGADLQEIYSFQSRLKTVSEIFYQHIYWTNFFNFLEDNTLKSVYYKGFEGDTGGNYALEAIASGYADIAGQVQLIKNNKLITDVQTAGGETVSGGSNSQVKVRFSLNFSILKNLFTE
jgi:hypothetical protein